MTTPRTTSSIPGLLTFDSLHLPTSLCRLPYVLRQEIVDYRPICVRLEGLTTEAETTWNLPEEFSEWDWLRKIVVSLEDTSRELLNSPDGRLLSFVETHTVGLTREEQLFDEAESREGIQRSYVPSSEYLRLVFGYFAHDFTRKPCLIWRHFVCVADTNVSVDGFLFSPMVFWLPLFPIQSLKVWCHENQTLPRELTCLRTPKLKGKLIVKVSSGSDDSSSAVKAGLGLFNWGSSRIETVRLFRNEDIKDVLEMIPGLCGSVRQLALHTPLSGNYRKLERAGSYSMPIGNLPSCLEELVLQRISDFSVLRIRGFLRSGTNLRKLLLLLPGLNDSPTMNCLAISSALEEFVFQSSALVKFRTNVRVPLDRWAENHEAKLNLRELELCVQPRCSCSDSKHSDLLSFDDALACVAKLFPNLRGYRNDGQKMRNRQKCLVRRHAENVVASLPQITHLHAPWYLSSRFLMALVAFRSIERLSVLIKLPTTEIEWVDWESIVFRTSRIVFLILAFSRDCFEETRWKRFMILSSRWTLHLKVGVPPGFFQLGDEELRHLKENGLSSLSVNEKEVFRKLWEEEVLIEKPPMDDE